MYFISVLLLLLVFPTASVVVEALYSTGVDIMWLIGKWFVFWACGVRLFVAGIMQTLRPEFTAKSIFETNAPAAHAIVREVGFGNLAVVGGVELECVAIRLQSGARAERRAGLLLVAGFSRDIDGGFVRPMAAQGGDGGIFSVGRPRRGDLVDGGAHLAVGAGDFYGPGVGRDRAFHDVATA